MVARHFESRDCHLEVVVVSHLVEEATGMIEEEDVNLSWMTDLRSDLAVGRRHHLVRITGNDHPFEISASRHQDTMSGDHHHDGMTTEVWSMARSMIVSAMTDHHQLWVLVGQVCQTQIQDQQHHMVQLC